MGARRQGMLMDWPPLRDGRIASLEEHLLGLRVLEALEAPGTFPAAAGLHDRLLELLMAYERQPVPPSGERYH